jgi:SPX domain protein involved in polyphosphate accumulation/uncharacterized membrane protein YidH (DUF202 family)
MNEDDFQEYLRNNSVLKWQEHYISYVELDAALNRIKQNKINSERSFIDKLELEYERYKGFIDDYVKNVESREITKEDMVEIIQMNSFMSHNQKSLKEVIKKHDKISKTKLWGTWKFRIKYKPFYKLLKSLHKFSDLNKAPEEKGDRKYDNESFVRKSKKFWVANDKIVPLISEIIKHLPIYVFKPGGDKEEVTEMSLDQEITSVYMDNPNLDIWRSRINKEDGSKLVRIRYYGDDQSNLFVERKIHYDSSISDKESTKDRFSLPADKIMPYLRGQHEVTGKNSGLGVEIQNFLADNKAVPFVRTVYSRIAFQLENSNDIRLSLDLNMRMIQEAVSHMEWITPDDKLTEAEIYNFPFGVLEVKLQGEHVTNPPEWIANIMDSDLTIPENSFSKFGHAMYIFYSERAGQVPSWCETHAEVFGPQRRNSNDTTFTTGTHAGPRIRFSGEETNNELGTDLNTPLLATRESRSSTKQEDQQTGQSLGDWLNGLCFGSNTPSPRRGGKVLKVEPKTFFANERTFLQWFNAGVLMFTVGLAALSLDQDGSNEIGSSLCGMSVVTLLYASYVYKRRNYVLKHKLVDVNLQDEWGPLVLVACLIGAIAVNVAVIG